MSKADRQQEIRAMQQARIAARQKKRLEINQDAELIREAAREALDGNGVSWIRLRKIKKLMEFESWRLYMLSRLNQLTQREERVHFFSIYFFVGNFYKSFLSTRFLILLY